MVGMEQQVLFYRMQQELRGDANIKILKSDRLLAILFVLMFVGCLKPTLRKFTPPEPTAWRPAGCRPEVTNNPALGAPTTYSRTFHGDSHNADEVSIAVPPVFEQKWVSQKDMFIVEGPTFDAAGNIYFTPSRSPESLLLVSLSPEDGSRRWGIPGKNVNGAGAPLVMNDPQNPQQQIVYVGTYERAFAVRTDGTMIWDVPTGLPAPALDEQSIGIHCFGLNYHAPSDSITGVTGDGHIYLLDRRTGKPRLEATFVVPGEKSPPAKILGVAVKNPLIQTILGGGMKVANYFAIDAHTGRIWVAATAPDEEDGKRDGLSEYGALYALEAVKGDRGYRIEEKFHVPFKGGSGTTPSLNADGSRIYVGDSFGNLLAINTTDGKILWTVDVGEQINASIAIASDNGELYAPTQKYIVKVEDKGDHGELMWRSQLDMYKKRPGQGGINLMGGIITANGVAIHAGAGPYILPLKVGVGLLDRETGRLRYFAEGREESVAVTTMGPDGSIYIGHSPIRRGIAHWIFFPLTPKPIIGGIEKFGATDHKLFVREAVCAAAARAENARDIAGRCPGSAEADLRQIGALIGQARRELITAAAAGQISSDKVELIEKDLSLAGEKFDLETLPLIADRLLDCCGRLQ
jgi:outer membrane protein assembly factor BamB